LTRYFSTVPPPAPAPAPTPCATCTIVLTAPPCAVYNGYAVPVSPPICPTTAAPPVPAVPAPYPAPSALPASPVPTNPMRLRWPWQHRRHGRRPAASHQRSPVSAQPSRR
jgi:hypothetical protein